MKKLKPREWILILVPCIFALGAWQSGTDSWLRKSIREASRQELYVESVETLVITPRDVQRGFVARLRVVFNCTGWRRPYWWANAKYGFTSTTDAPSDLVIRRNGKVVVLPFSKKHVAPTIGGYDRERDRYVSEYDLNLATLPQTPFDVVLQSQMWITSRARKIASNKALVSHLVRRANSVVRTPIVSRESGFTLTNLYVRRLSTTASKNKRADVVFVFGTSMRKKTQVDVFARKSNDTSQLVDDERKLVYAKEGNVLNGLHYYEGVVRYDVRRAHLINYELNKNLPRRLVLRGQLSLPGYWPVEYGAVVHDPSKGLDLRRLKAAPANASYSPDPENFDRKITFSQRPLPRNAWRSSVIAPEKYRVR